MSLVLLPAAWIFGCLIFRPLGGVDAVRAYPFALLLCGLAWLAALLLLLGSFSLSLALMVSVLLGAGGAYLCFRDDSQPEPTDFEAVAGEPAFPRAVAWSLLTALGLSLLLGFLASLAPVTSWDAAVAHLALPADYARAGRIEAGAGNVYSAYPHLAHTLYAVAYSGGGERSVTLLNWLFGLAACYAVYGLARELAGRHAGLAAAAILAAAPVFADQIGGVSIDLIFAAFTTTALWMLLRWHRSLDLMALCAAGLLAGASCGIRHTGFLVATLLLVGVLLATPRAARVPALGVYLVALIFSAAPWMLRTALATGNPLFPFFHEWFSESPIDHIAITGGMHETARGSGLGLALALLRFPWDIIMRPQDFDGWTKSPGALVLILGVPAALALGARERGVAAFSGAGGLALFFFQRFARYFLPFFVPMIALAGAGAVRFKRLRPLVLAVLLAHVAFGLVLHAAAMHFKVPAALGLVSRADYLRARIERIEMFEYANRQLLGGGRVFTLDQRSYYLDAPAYQNHWSLEKIVAMQPDERLQWMREQGIHHILYPSAYVADSGNIRAAAEELLRQLRAEPERYPLRARIEAAAPGGMEEVLVFDVAGANAP
ncbi:MAG: hypothetical protein RLZZ303_240 [Candidatus Hydrogenedentota bacterium]